MDRGEDGERREQRDELTGRGGKRRRPGRQRQRQACAREQVREVAQTGAADTRGNLRE